MLSSCPLYRRTARTGLSEDLGGTYPSQQYLELILEDPEVFEKDVPDDGVLDPSISALDDPGAIIRDYDLTKPCLRRVVSIQPPRQVRLVLRIHWKLQPAVQNTSRWQCQTRPIIGRGHSVDGLSQRAKLWFSLHMYHPLQPAFERNT